MKPKFGNHLNHAHKIGSMSQTLLGVPRSGTNLGPKKIKDTEVNTMSGIHKMQEELIVGEDIEFITPFWKDVQTSHGIEIFVVRLQIWSLPHVTLGIDMHVGYLMILGNSKVMKLVLL